MGIGDVMKAGARVAQIAAKEAQGLSKAEGAAAKVVGQAGQAGQAGKAVAAEAKVAEGWLDGAAKAARSARAAPPDFGAAEVLRTHREALTEVMGSQATWGKFVHENAHPKLASMLQSIEAGTAPPNSLLARFQSTREFVDEVLKNPAQKVGTGWLDAMSKSSDDVLRSFGPGQRALVANAINEAVAGKRVTAEAGESLGSLGRVLRESSNRELARPLIEQLKTALAGKSPKQVEYALKLLEQKATAASEASVTMGKSKLPVGAMPSVPGYKREAHLGMLEQLFDPKTSLPQAKAALARFGELLSEAKDSVVGGRNMVISTPGK